MQERSLNSVHFSKGCTLLYTDPNESVHLIDDHIGDIQCKDGIKQDWYDRLKQDESLLASSQDVFGTDRELVQSLLTPPAFGASIVGVFSNGILVAANRGYSLAHCRCSHLLHCIALLATF